MIFSIFLPILDLSQRIWGIIGTLEQNSAFCEESTF